MSNVNEISQGINALKNRIDEALNRSASATLNSHRGFSASLETAPQQYETVRQAAAPYDDLYRSVQNYQVKTVNGFEPNYFPVQAHYGGYVQPQVIPYGYYPVQEVRSATYSYEPYVNQFYQPIEYVVDDYEVRQSNSAKKRSTKARKQNIQNDQDSFSKDPKKNQAPTQQNQTSAAPQNQAAQLNPTKGAVPQPKAGQQANIQPPQQNPVSNQPTQQNPASNQPTQQNPASNQPTQQNTQQNNQQNNQQGQQNKPNNNANTNQQGQQNKPNNNANTNQQGQQGQQPAIDKSSLVMLPKKPFLIDTYNFGHEQRKGGSKRI